MEWNDVLKLYFSQRGMIYHQIESYDKFLTSIQDTLRNKLLVINDIKGHTQIQYNFLNVAFHRPSITPQEARLRNMSYNLIVTVEICETVLHEDGKIEKKLTPSVKLCELPLMLNTRYCHLWNLPEEKRIALGECYLDCGGYFIKGGKERVIVCQERLNFNQLNVWSPQKANEKKCYLYIAEVRSFIQDSKKPAILKVGISRDKRKILAIIPEFSSPFPVGILLHLLGANTDEKIRNLLLTQDKDAEYTELIEGLIYSSFPYRGDESILYIGSLLSESVVEKSEETKQIIEIRLLPHLGTEKTKKLFYVSHMIKELFKVVLGKRTEDDRDSFLNKRVDTAGKLLDDLFQGYLEQYLEKLSEKLKVHPGNLSLFEREPLITNSITSCMNTGNWFIQKNGYKKVGVCQLLTRLTYTSVLSHLRRVSSNRSTEGKATKMRQLHPSQWGIFDPAETPEGKYAGVVKNLSLTGHITSGSSEVLVRQLLLRIVEPLRIETFTALVFLNGDLLGTVKNPAEVSKHLKTLRRNGVLHHEVSIAYRESDNDLLVLTDAGRCTRPLFVVENGSLLPLGKTQSWNELISSGVIQYVDTVEEQESLVATYPSDITKDHNYCELHPSMMLGICSSVIPFLDHNQSPRNAYSASMTKQAIGIFASNYLLRFDTSSYVLHYPQKAIVSPISSEYFHYDKLPCGTNVVVAVMSYTGFNQEDSVIINKSAIERGLFVVTVYKTFVAEEKNQGNQIIETIELPPEKVLNRSKNYLKLGKNGIIRQNEVLEKGDIIVGKTVRKGGKNSEKIDVSLFYKLEERGRVDRILITTDGEGNRLVKVRVAFVRSLEMGDKVASRHAQKATVGLVLSQEDMPFSATTGTVPDLIINPNCLPSRMTIAQFIECLLGKYGAISGELINGSPFVEKIPQKVKEISQKLINLGFQGFGEELMYNGMTGEMLLSSVFVGPTYYQNLKHMVKDKLSARSSGPIQLLTRQPANHGRKHGIAYTSIRFGTMETDALIAHGASYSIRERLFISSDRYSTGVCQKCGMIANKCCGNCVETNMPYAMKLLYHNLGGLQIASRLRTFV